MKVSDLLDASFFYCVVSAAGGGAKLRSADHRTPSTVGTLQSRALQINKPDVPTAPAAHIVDLQNFNRMHPFDLEPHQDSWVANATVVGHLAPRQIQPPTPHLIQPTAFQRNSAGPLC